MRKAFYLTITAVIILLLFSACAAKKQQVKFTQLTHPKREFRGAWISTAWQSRYTTMSTARMQVYFINILDELQKQGINAIIFQARPYADAFYKSDLEPWSAFFTGKQGLAPVDGFDPLAFIIRECHKRNMELHAWLNPYRVTSGENDVLATNHIYYQHPEWFVKYGKNIYFDPGLPSCRQFICNVVTDIVSRYEVDAIHMDDYFYPYPIAGEPFPDDKSFNTYREKQGFALNQRADWRRNNVNTLIREVKNAIVLTKPWVRFGVSPFGIYRNKKTTPDGSGSETNGSQNYDDLYADVKLWVKEGWIDYNMPQLYWEIGHKAADYSTLVKWWSANNYKQPLYIGQDVERTMNASSASGETQLAQKILESRNSPQTIHGNCFWPAYSLIDNYKGIGDELKANYHKYPALIPAYTHMHNKKPKKVKGLKEEYTATSHTLKWASNSNKQNPETAQYYVIYRFAKGEQEDIEKAQAIVAIDKGTSHTLPYEGGKKEYRYVVTAVDAFHNESKGQSKKVKL